MEDLDNYNLIYAMTEICPNSPDNRVERDHSSMEGNTALNKFGGWIDATYNATKVTSDVTFTPFSALFGGV